MDLVVQILAVAKATIELAREVIRGPVRSAQAAPEAEEPQALACRLFTPKNNGVARRTKTRATVDFIITSAANSGKKPNRTQPFTQNQDTKQEWIDRQPP